MNSSTHTFNDAELMKHIVSGDLSAIKLIYQQHKKMFDLECISLNFILSCIYDQLDIMKFFHSLGLDINYHNGKALICAIQNDNFDMVEYLIDNNINLDLDKSTHSLSYACSTSNFLMIQYLYEKGCEVNNLSLKNALCSSYFVQEKKIDIIIFLLEHIKKENKDSIDFDFLLTRAISEKNLPLVRYLVEHGVSVNSLSERDKNNSPLQNACFKNCLPIVQYLVENGANINANDGWALQISCRDGNLDIVKYLIEQGADVSLKNNYALKVCMKPINEHLNLEHIIYYLVSHGADINIDDGYCFFVEASKKEVNYNVLSFFIDNNFVIPDESTSHYSFPPHVKQWVDEYLQKKEFSTYLQNELTPHNNDNNNYQNMNPTLEKKLKI